MKKEVKIVIGIGIVVIGLGVLLFAKSGPSSTGTNTSSNVGPGKNNTGSPTAKVQVVEFGDFQCPACAAAEPLVEKLILAYQTNPNVNFSFRNFPLPQHPNAQITSEAAEAAGAQGKYWEMHNKIYAEQNAWASLGDALPLLVSYAQGFGLNVDQFKNDIQNKKYQDVINSDQSAGEQAGVNATPTFFVNGKKFEGVPNEQAFQQAIDEALAK